MLGRPDSEFVDVHVDEGVVVALATPNGQPADARSVVEGRGALAAPPYVEPHIHLDSVLTAGEPRWNETGTLWEGIACWTERKASLSREDVIERAEEVIGWQVANGVLFIRSHVDITDPNLVALEALIEVRDRVRDVVDLQLVAFPQEGICSFHGGEQLMQEAIRRGVDAVGAIPHFEDTREDGIRSLEIAVNLACRFGLLVDVHCDEIDDDQSRFIEVLATQALRTGMADRVTASHTTAMGSYPPAYSFKLHRTMRRSGINVVANPLVNLHLQGRFDEYPKRRGMTQVKELLEAGINVAFGHDTIMDPWYPIGTGNPVEVALVGAHAAQMMAPHEITECFQMVTDRAARVMALGDRYGIRVGVPANLLLFSAEDPFDIVRRQVRPSHVISRGRVVATNANPVATLDWPGRASTSIDWVRSRDTRSNPEFPSMGSGTLAGSSASG